MNTNLKVIRFTAIFSGISFLATFAVCLNISYEWLIVKWISNEFLLTIFGGLFTSTLFALICEIQKYFLNKKQSENAMYNYCTKMLVHFLAAKTLLTELVNDKNKLATENLLKSLCDNVGCMMNAYFSVDYTTCFKKKSLYSAREDFNKILVETVQRTLTDCIYFNFAINQIKKMNLINGIPEHCVNTQNNLLLEVVNAFINEFNVCIENITAFVEKIDYSGRFQFKERFINARKNQENHMQESFENFLKRNCQ